MAKPHATLIFSRHGESQWNVDNRFTGWVDVDLSAKGLGEAKSAGELLKSEGLKLDCAFTSFLKRAIKTCDLALEASGQLHIPVTKTWRLNERMYGGLTGLDKKETVKKHGAEKVQIWRRSFDIPPPEIDDDNEFNPAKEYKYRLLDKKDIPKTECLKDTIARVMPFWEEEIAPKLKAGKTVFVAAHGNSIRAILKFIENIPDDVITGLEIPTGTPLLYGLDADLKPMPCAGAMAPLQFGRYLGDAEKIKAAAEAVKNQTKVGGGAATDVPVAAKIESIRAREIFDSRGNPTVEVDLCTSAHQFRAAVPSGASTGVYEALELRDMDKGRLLGKGVLKAIANVNDIIAPKLVGMDVREQEKIDKLMVEELDGSKNEWGWSKSKLGANAILAVSMAVCRAGAAANQMALYEYIAKISGKPMDKFVLPVPSFNVINGGSHAGNRLACQEFMILPVGASSFREAMIIGAEVYHTLKSVIKKKYGQDACNVGDEGGFAPNVQDNSEALDVLMSAIEKSGHAAKVKIGTDVAASEFYNADKKEYDLDFKNPDSGADMKKSATQLGDYYKAWLDKYPLISIEDPFDQDDWDAYTMFMKDVGAKVQIVGDDLLVTNPTRVKKALDAQACNALLLKVNQIGSITEAIEAATMSQRRPSRDLEEAEPDASERGPGGSVAEAVLSAGLPVQQLLWLSPLVVFLSCLLMQSVWLHAATHRYVYHVSRLEGWPEGGPLAAGEDDLYGPLSFATAGLRDSLADGLREPAGLERVLVLVLATMVPILWFIAVLLSRNVRLWARTLAVGSILALLNGLSAWTTVVPEPLGWTGCRERLHPWALSYFQGQFQILHSLPLVLFLWLQDVFLGMRKQDALVCVTGFVGSSYLTALFAISLFDAVRAFTRRFGQGPRLACRGGAALLLSVLVLADSHQEMALRRQYGAGLLVAVVLPLLLYSSTEVALVTDYFLRWATGTVAEEGAELGDILLPPCCFPFCCLAGRYFLYREPTEEVEDLLRGRTETAKTLDSLRKDQEDTVWRMLELEAQLEYVRQRMQVRERQDAMEAERGLSERLLTQQKAHEKRVSRMLAELETHKAAQPVSSTEGRWWRALLPADRTEDCAMSSASSASSCMQTAVAIRQATGFPRARSEEVRPRPQPVDTALPLPPIGEVTPLAQLEGRVPSSLRTEGPSQEAGPRAGFGLAPQPVAHCAPPTPEKDSSTPSPPRFSGAVSPTLPSLQIPMPGSDRQESSSPASAQKQVTTPQQSTGGTTPQAWPHLASLPSPDEEDGPRPTQPHSSSSTPQAGRTPPGWPQMALRDPDHKVNQSRSSSSPAGSAAGRSPTSAAVSQTEAAESARDAGGSPSADRSTPVRRGESLGVPPLDKESTTGSAKASTTAGPLSELATGADSGRCSTGRT